MNENVLITDDAVVLGILVTCLGLIFYTAQLKGLKYKNRNSKVLHPDNMKLFENPVEDSEDAFKHLCDGCSEVFETKGLYPISTWCPHCSKGNLLTYF